MLAAIITVQMFLSRLEQAHGPVSHAGLVLSAQLTEGDCVTLSQRAGLSVTTEHPTTPVTEQQVNTYFDVFREQLVQRGGDDSELEHRKHKHKHKKHKSPCDPNDD